MLRARKLSKAYRTTNVIQPVVDGLDLDVASGQLIAVLGASGSGKTTLLNLLSGIDAPDNGEVLLGQTEIHRLDEPDKTLLRRREIGFVFQFFNLIPTLTVAENLALAMDLVGTENALVARRTDELLDAVGLSHVPSRFPDTLSGGEQQRVAIARALAHRPRLLLADEPTGNLDQRTGRDVISLLSGMARDHGTTMVIATHSDVVASVADQAYRLEQGRLTAA